MIYSINKFRHYLLGKKFTFHVDHMALLYVVSKQVLTGKLARWMLLLQEFDFDIQHRPSSQHVVADYLNRIENVADVVEGDDHFPDGAILHIDTNDPEHHNAPPEDKWLTEMSEFLNTGFPPPRLRTDEKKRLAVRSWNLCMIQDTLYHKGSDGVWRICILRQQKDRDDWLRAKVNRRLKQKTEDFDRLYREHKQAEADHMKRGVEFDRQLEKVKEQLK